jgi:hypothetical protein
MNQAPPARRPVRRTVLLGFGALLAAGAALWATRTPSHERSWIPEQAVLPAMQRIGDTVVIEGFRNFRYLTADSFVAGYDRRAFDLNRLASVWFVLTPFAKAWRGPAHSFLSFGFSDSQYVAISVEARKEPGERYGPLSGMLRRFELMYVIGDERDLIGQRVLQEYPVYLYPVQASREKMAELFLAMLERAQALRTTPEFYHTLTNNCTSNIVDHVNRIAPGTIPPGWKTVLPGYIDEVGMRLGLIQTGLDPERARERYRINDAGRRYLGDPAFSLRIR